MIKENGLRPGFFSAKYFFLFFIVLILCLTATETVFAEIGTNPAGGNPADYAGGNWVGTGNPDQLTNNQGAFVNGYIYGNDNNSVNGFNGGENTITNHGRVQAHITGSFNDRAGASGGANIIINTSTGIVTDIIGSINRKTGASGGDNTIENSGTINHDLMGSHNCAADTYGGGNIIKNSGAITGLIAGSYNQETGSYGGGNIISSSGAVGDSIYGSKNSGNASTGGGNVITNSGTVSSHIVGSENMGAGAGGGENSITNSGDVNGFAIIGSINMADGNKGGDNTITNKGTVQALYGSYNSGNASSGGGNTITNSNNIGFHITGSYNRGDGASGGSNRIKNTGTTSIIYGSFNSTNATGSGNSIENSGTVQSLNGSYNDGAGSSGGSNTVINTGEAGYYLAGSYNLGAGSNGGGNTVINSGSVNDYIWGTYNRGDNTSGGGNTIINSGSVGSDIYGTFNEGAGATSGGQGNTITNYGTVGGSIYAGDADDTVTIKGASTVGGTVDGQTGSDTLCFDSAGTRAPDQYVSFESLLFTGSGTTTLVGAWDYTGHPTVVQSGKVKINGSLTTSSLSNKGSLIVNGSMNAGLLTNNGRVYINGTAHARTINRGLLVVNGLLYGAVENSGIVEGVGRIYGDIATISGCLSPGNSIGSITVLGNYTHSADSEYYCEVAKDGSSDSLHAEKNILIQGGFVTVDLPKGLYASNTRWSILTADQAISGRFDTLHAAALADSAVLSLSLDYGAREVALVLARKPYESFGRNRNQRSAGAGLDRILPYAKANNDAMAGFINTMDWSYSAGQIQDVLSACNPEMYDGITWAALESARLFDGIMMDRADWTRTAAGLGAELNSLGGPVELAAEATNKNVAAEPMRDGWSMWARALGSWNRRSGSNENLGYDSSTGGMVLGADGALLPWLKLGMAFAVGNTDINYSQGGYDGSQKSVQGGLYATAENDGLFLDAALSYSDFNNDANRNLDINDAVKGAEASFESSSWMSRLGGGWDYQNGDWLLGARLDLSYLSLSEESFREKNADYLSLNVDSRDSDYWSTSLGLKAATRWETGLWALLPRLDVKWLHLFGNDPRGIAASFRDYPEQGFTVWGLTPNQDGLRMQAGLRAVLDRHANLFVQYGVTLGDDMSYQDFTAGINYSF